MSIAHLKYALRRCAFSGFVTGVVLAFLWMAVFLAKAQSMPFSLLSSFLVSIGIAYPFRGMVSYWWARLAITVPCLSIQPMIAQYLVTAYWIQFDFNSIWTRVGFYLSWGIASGLLDAILLTRIWCRQGTIKVPIVITTYTAATAGALLAANVYSSLQQAGISLLQIWNVPGFAAGTFASDFLLVFLSAISTIPAITLNVAAMAFLLVEWMVEQEPLDENLGLSLSEEQRPQT